MYRIAWGCVRLCRNVYRRRRVPERSLSRVVHPLQDDVIILTISYNYRFDSGTGLTACLVECEYCTLLVQFQHKHGSCMVTCVNTPKRKTPYAAFRSGGTAGSAFALPDAGYRRQHRTARDAALPLSAAAAQCFCRICTVPLTVRRSSPGYRASHIKEVSHESYCQRSRKRISVPQGML